MRALTEEGLFVKAIFNAQGSIRARGIPVGVTCVSLMGYWVGGHGQCPLDMAHQVGCSGCGRWLSIDRRDNIGYGLFGH